MTGIAERETEGTEGVRKKWIAAVPGRREVGDFRKHQHPDGLRRQVLLWKAQARPNDFSRLVTNVAARRRSS
jgi:hypothetical protein